MHLVVDDNLNIIVSVGLGGFVNKTCELDSIGSNNEEIEKHITKYCFNILIENCVL